MFAALLDEFYSKKPQSDLHTGAKVKLCGTHSGSDWNTQLGKKHGGCFPVSSNTPGNWEHFTQMKLQREFQETECNYPLWSVAQAGGLNSAVLCPQNKARQQIYNR